MNPCGFPVACGDGGDADVVAAVAEGVAADGGVVADTAAPSILL